MRIFLSLAFTAMAAHAQSYVKDVYPIWEKHCLGCHASGTKMGSLDIETWEGIQRGGNHGTILVPGDVKASRLYTMLIGESKPAMPMDGQVLSAGEIEVVRKWIASGATAPNAAEILMLKQRAAGEDPAVTKPKSKPQIFSLAWRPGSAEVAVGRFQTVDLLDPTTKQVRATLEGHAEVVRALTFSKDGKLLAAAGGRPGRNGEVIIWNVESKAVVTKLSGHKDAIYSVAFSPDGRLLATASYDKFIKLWDPATGQEIRTLKDHIDAIYALAFTPDGQRLISGAADRTVKVWNPTTGERLYTLSDPTDGINAIALSPDGKRVAAAGLDKNIRIWELGEKSGTLIQSAIAHEDAIIALAWSPDGTRIISSCADKTLKIFNATDLAELKSLPGQSDWVYGLAFSGDSAKIAVGRFDGSFALLER